MGPALAFAVLVFCHHNPDLALLIQDVSHVSLAQWALPQFKNHAQIFTFHLPIMN